VKEKYANDAKILEKALKTEPDNPRYWFYLAQSYRDSGQHKKAIQAYQKRATMGGWQEEVYVSLYHVALISDRIKLKDTLVMEAYSKAWETRPHRLEAVYELMKMLRIRNRHIMSFTYGNMAAQNFRDVDTLFVNVPIKKWLFIDEYCMAAYYVGQPELALENSKALIESETFNELPEEEQTRLKANHQYYVDAVNERKSKDA
jgi:tetratricopeptide (TPR) repeat protein